MPILQNCLINHLNHNIYIAQSMLLQFNVGPVLGNTYLSRANVVPLTKIGRRKATSSKGHFLEKPI